MSTYINPNNSYFQGYKPLQIRNGSTTALANYIPAAGELVYTTNTNQVWVGDGVTPGGHIVTGNGGGGNLDFGTITNPAGFSLDLGSI